MSIEFEAKSDRELLIMSVMQGNESNKHLARINSRLDKHEARIQKLEGNPHPIQKINWQYLMLIGSVIALVVVSVGTNIGWW